MSTHTTKIPHVPFEISGNLNFLKSWMVKLSESYHIVLSKC